MDVQKKHPTTARDIFIAAYGISDSSKRQSFLAEACRSDEKLKRRIESMLASEDSEKTNPLDRMGIMLNPTDLATDSVPLHRPRGDIENHPLIGPYQLMEKIGEGGMGVVYVARQQQPIRRTVALKLIKPGMDSKQVIARFEAERQTLAMMNHSNIAKVLDAGTTESGLPYFVMELVKGTPITEYCDAHKLDLRQRLDLFIKVCKAVQHAHQKGIIHRDLKPSNVLVELEDVRSVPKVIDFGVAKATQQPLVENAVYTGLSQMIGTPLYMSPEQAEYNSLDVDTRSDVYSLGVMLYELLTGSTPFDRDLLKKASFDEMRRIIREDVPARPSSRISASTETNRRLQLAPNSTDSTVSAKLFSTLFDRRGNDARQPFRSVQHELDWIVMKALEKDRIRRFQSASDLAEDIQRYLDGDAIESRPPSVAYRFRKTVARYRTQMFVAGIMLLALVITSLLSTLMLVREKELVSQREQVQQKVTIALTNLARLKNQSSSGQLSSTNVDEMDRQLQIAQSLADTHGIDTSTKSNIEQFAKELRESQRSLQLMVDLDAAWQGRATIYADGGRLSSSAMIRPIEQAFSRYGIAPAQVSPEQAVGLIDAESSQVRELVLAALDEWRLDLYPIVGARSDSETLAYSSDPVVNWIRSVVNAADADPWSRQLRDAEEIAEPDQRHAELERLANLTDLKAQSPRVLCRLSKGLPDEQAIPLLKRIQQNHPSDLWVNYELGERLRTSNPPKYEEAVRYYVSAAALKPDCAGVHNNLGIVLHQLWELDSAAAAYRKALLLNPGMIITRINLSCLLWEQNEREGATKEIQRALQYIPDEPRHAAYLPVAYRFLGLYTRGQGRYEEALAAYRQCLILKDQAPRNIDLNSIYVEIGRTLQLQGKLDDAISAYDEAVRLMKSSVNYQNQRDGYVKSERSQLADYSIALRLTSPSLASAYTYLGECLHLRGSTDEALAAFDQLLSIGTGSPDELVYIHRKMADLLTKDARHAEAAQHFQSILDAELAVTQSPSKEVYDRRFLMTRRALLNALQASKQPAFAEAALLRDLERWQQLEKVRSRLSCLTQQFDILHALAHEFVKSGRKEQAEEMLTLAFDRFDRLSIDENRIRHAVLAYLNREGEVRPEMSSLSSPRQNQLRQLVLQTLPIALASMPKLTRNLSANGRDLEEFGQLALASYQEGSWDGTEEHARVGLKAAEGRPLSMVHVAPLLLLAGKQEEYHELCEALLDNGQDWKDETLVAVSILCTLDPKTPNDPAKFKHLVQRAAEVNPQFGTHLLRRACIRLGEYSCATVPLEADADGLTLAEVALAYHYAGNSEEAHSLLERAQAAFGVFRAESSTARLEYTVILEESKRLIFAD